METNELRKERRQSPRMLQSLDILYEVEERIGICTTRDVGLGGIYIVTEAEFEVGQSLQISLRLDDGSWLTLPGEVVYTTLSGVGVKFIEINEEQEENLLSAMMRWGQN